MGLKIKFWTNIPVVEEAPKKGRKTKVAKANSPFVEVEVDVATLGFTVDAWLDRKNEEKVEKAVQSIPGIRYDWGFTQVRC